MSHVLIIRLSCAGGKLGEVGCVFGRGYFESWCLCGVFYIGLDRQEVIMFEGHVWAKYGRIYM